MCSSSSSVPTCNGVDQSFTSRFVCASRRNEFISSYTLTTQTRDTERQEGTGVDGPCKLDDAWRATAGWWRHIVRQQHAWVDGTQYLLSTLHTASSRTMWRHVWADGSSIYYQIESCFNQQIASNTTRSFNVIYSVTCGCYSVKSGWFCWWRLCQCIVQSSSTIRSSPRYR